MPSRLSALVVTLLLGMSWEALAASGSYGLSGGGGGRALVVSGPGGFTSLSSRPSEISGASLRVASREGRIKEVLELLSQDVDPNAMGEFGETALIFASRFNQRQVTEALLAHGAEVNSRDSSDETALLKAAKNCSSKISSLLLSRNADVNWINREGKSALIVAADVGCEAIVQQLVQVRGIRINERDNAGRTALDDALEEAQIEVGGPYSRIVATLRKAGGQPAELAMPLPKTAAPETPAKGSGSVALP